MIKATKYNRVESVIYSGSRKRYIFVNVIYS